MHASDAGTQRVERLVSPRVVYGAGVRELASAGFGASREA
jgi:hypothetical protein